MPRRLIALLVTLVLTTLFVSPVSPAQWPAKNVPTIGVLSLGSPPSLPDWKQRSVLLQELSTLGWMEGQNVTVEYRWASGRSHRLTDLAAELVHRHVDVIVVDDTPAIQAVQHVTTTIPTVAFFAIDPVAEGYVASLARPGGNITGVGGVAPE